MATAQLPSGDRPDFRAPGFLIDHMRRIIDFYHPACLNEADGGYYNEFRDDGRITDRTTQHLVGTARFVINFALAAGVLGRPNLRDAAAHGVTHLDRAHRDREHGGYFWILERDRPRDATKHCYGHAFVFLAYATALMAGIEAAKGLLAETWDLLEERFFDPENSLYRDELGRDWTTQSPYRGQNANMHMAEAMLAGFEATGDGRYLDRALLLARRVCVDLADRAGGLVWEHYHADWSVDWGYNKEKPRDLFRPWGYLPGHLTEWAKLLLILERHRKQDWLLPRARHFYDTALLRGADLAHGGMLYSFAPDGAVVDSDKYYWVHAETIAAAAALAQRTGGARYWQDYDRLWAYSWAHLVDRERGGWYRLLSDDGHRYDDLKSPPSKADYHPLGACREVLRVLGAS